MNDKCDHWKKVSFEACNGLHSIEYIHTFSFRCSNFEIWMPTYKQIRKQHYDNNFTDICCAGIVTTGEILHTICIRHNWYCISCIIFKFFNPVSQGWYCLIWHLWLFFWIQNSIHIAHIITLSIVDGTTASNFSPHLTQTPKMCWCTEFINEGMWVVDLVHILKCGDIIFLAECTTIQCA